MLIASITSDLQPCPFCGGAVNYRFFEPDTAGDYEGEHQFACNDCEATVLFQVDLTWMEAIAIYNKRSGERKDE